MIICNVGEKEFKSESYIDAFLEGTNSMYDANCKTTGGYICGEVKLAVTLRLLAGGDALDLGVIFDIGSNYCNTIMFDVLRNWIILYDIGQMNMMNFSVI